MFDKERLSSYIKWDRIPQLNDPLLVAGFRGWSDAGGVSSDTLAYLSDSLQPEAIGHLNNEPFLNYALDRPVAEVRGGIIRTMDPMVTHLKYWADPAGVHDLVMFLGKEPHYNWLAYSSVLVDAMTRLGISRLVTVGGVQDTISHSSPPAVSVVASSLPVLEQTAQLEPSVRPAEYSGPISIHSHLLTASAEAGIPAVSLWAHVPAYLQKNPRMVATLVKIVNRTAGSDCRVDALMKESIELDRKIDEAMSRDPNLKQFVEAIEGKQDPPEDASREDKIIRLNDFLRRDPNRDPDPS